MFVTKWRDTPRDSGPIPEQWWDAVHFRRRKQFDDVDNVICELAGVVIADDSKDVLEPSESIAMPPPIQILIGSSFCDLRRCGPPLSWRF